MQSSAARKKKCLKIIRQISQSAWESIMTMYIQTERRQSPFEGLGVCCLQHKKEAGDGSIVLYGFVRLLLRIITFLYQSGSEIRFNSNFSDFPLIRLLHTKVSYTSIKKILCAFCSLSKAKKHGVLFPCKISFISYIHPHEDSTNNSPVTDSQI